MEKTKKWTEKYEELDILGEGGNAVVYLVREKNTGDEYALKELQNRTEEKKKRFLNEIQIEIENAELIIGMVPVIDFNKEQYWYTMPIAIPVMSIIKEKNIFEIVNGVIQLSETLEQLHNKKIYHKHNELQKAIIEEFAPRFAPNSECLYVGDTIEKDLVKNVEKLKELGFEITLHDKMPDVVLYREDKNWIYFIESVTSVGPMDPKRILEITEMTKDVMAGKIFVTAFLNFKTYKKFAEELAWETEVWIAEMPEHMIHLNGDRFMGPR